MRVRSGLSHALFSRALVRATIAPVASCRRPHTHTHTLTQRIYIRETATFEINVHMYNVAGHFVYTFVRRCIYSAYRPPYFHECVMNTYVSPYIRSAAGNFTFSSVLLADDDGRKVTLPFPILYTCDPLSRRAMLREDKLLKIYIEENRAGIFMHKGIYMHKPELRMTILKIFFQKQLKSKWF